MGLRDALLARPGIAVASLHPYGVQPCNSGREDASADATRMQQQQVLHRKGDATPEATTTQPTSCMPGQIEAAAAQPIQPERPATARVYLLAGSEADEAHVELWAEDAITAFIARRDRLHRRGYSAGDADDLAERLHLRDRRGDDRRMCVECSHLGDGGRCLAAAMGRLPGTSRRHEPVPTLLQRCEAFGQRKGLR